MKFQKNKTQNAISKTVMFSKFGPIYLLSFVLFMVPKFSFADCDYNSYGLSVDFAKDPPVLIATESLVEEVEKKQTNTYYFQLEIEKWKLSKELKKKDYEKLPTKTLNTKKLHFIGKRNEEPFFVSSEGMKFTFKTRDCEEPAEDHEGGPFCKKLDVNFNKKTLIVDCEKFSDYGCDSLSEIDQWGEQVWLGLSSQGECSDRGAGLGVFDLKTLKVLYSSPKKEGLLVREIIPVEKANQVWVFSDEALDVYNKKFEILRRCQFYPTTNYSEHSVKCDILKDEKNLKPKK